jgi:hypothetical protein
MTSRGKTEATAGPAAPNALITSKDASKKLSSSTAAQQLLEDTADDAQTAEECQAAKSPNQTQKLQPPATLQGARCLAGRSHKQMATFNVHSSQGDSSLAAKAAKSKLKWLVRSTGDDLVQPKGLIDARERRRESQLGKACARAGCFSQHALCQRSCRRPTTKPKHLQPEESV